MRAFSMLSGGLDSQVSTRLMQQQGIEVIAVHFFHRFHRAGDAGCWPDSDGLPPAAQTIRETAARLGVELVLSDFSEQFLHVANDPRHGRGKGFNPCLDCRIVMLDLARLLMEKYGASFVFTGEVLGQRPMSQHKHGLDLVAKRSGLERLLLRPLSARLLTPTTPEEQGWVDREQLLALQGRNRKPQMALAKQMGIEGYPMPAGGCFLTDTNVAARFFSWTEHHGPLGPREMVAFRVGRHFRLPEGTHAVVGRDERENNVLRDLLGDMCHLTAKGVPGAWVYFFQSPTEKDLSVAARLAARYSDAKEKTAIEIAVFGLAEPKTIIADPLEDAVLDRLRV